jgi:hypothetical protein
MEFERISEFIKRGEAAAEARLGQIKNLVSL